jgi:hypothetical protein
LGLQGIAIVDGCIVTAPLLQALQNRTIDVPLILGSMAQEPDAQPDRLVGNFSEQQYAEMLERAFSPWGVTAPAKVRQLYAQEEVQGINMAYSSMIADYGAFCGNAAVAATAARSLLSPVYHYVIQEQPSAPVWNFDVRAPSKLAFHSWDILSGFGNYGIFSGPLGLPLYNASARDLALGLTIRSAWFQLMQTGALQEESNAGWQPVPKSAQGGATVPPAGYTTGVILANGTSSRPDYRKHFCEFWFHLGLSEGYWWAN